MTTPCLLLILDGWGINSEVDGNAIAKANTPYLDSLFKDYPHSKLICSGKEVGLPGGIMGNSEVGHLNIGAGRVVYQDLLRIDRSIEDRSFFDNSEINNLVSTVKNAGKAVHLMGLVSDGGVHSQMEHLFALVDLAEEKGIEEVNIHVILDGRDTPPESGANFVEKLQSYITGKKNTRIATLCGRFYAMDRDTRWERTEKAYKLYTQAEGVTEIDPVEAVKNAYSRGETDEFVVPIVLAGGSETTASGIIKDGDGVIFFNFRADRARQITRALTKKEFEHFNREALPDLSGYLCMTLYDSEFTLPIAFPPESMTGILGEVISRNGLKQLRIAETEKYAHVTYFFNGGSEDPFPNEDRCLIPSPREVATYDLKPEMSAAAVAKEVVSKMKETDYDLVVVNLANMDMVGHTGVFDAAVSACEEVDRCVKEIIEYTKASGMPALVTADHGNAEKMVGDEGSPFTSHTLNPVPVIYVGNSRGHEKMTEGALGDIAPTILDIMEIEKPEEMTGKSLFIK